MYRDKIIDKEVKVKVVDFSKKLHRVCRVDQFNAQPFNKGDFGWSRNTVSAMAHAANYSEFLALAQQIAKTPKQFNLPKGCSLKDAMALLSCSLYGPETFILFFIAV